jgi:hypothetical protein
LKFALPASEETKLSTPEGNQATQPCILSAILLQKARITSIRCGLQHHRLLLEKKNHRSTGIPKRPEDYHQSGPTGSF